MTASRFEGRVSGIDPDGHLTGWCSDPTDQGRELSILVSVGTWSGQALSNGMWYHSTKRRFALPLPDGLQDGAFLPVHVTLPDGQPCRGSPLFVAPHGGRWIMAAPFDIGKDTISGAFLIADQMMTPVEVELAGGASSAVCDLPTDSGFNNWPCGFRLRLNGTADLDGALLNLKHPALPASLPVAVSDLLPAMQAGGERKLATLPLVIVDNNLLDERGHHLAMADALSRAALSMDMPVTVYSHVDFPLVHLPDGVAVRPVFRRSVYQHLASQEPGIDPSEELKTVLALAEHDHPDGARLLFHTADAFTYTALAEWLKESGETSAPFYYHVGTPYEPHLMPGLHTRDEKLQHALHDLAVWQGDQRHLFFWAETSRLAENLNGGYAAKARHLAFPAAPWTQTSGGNAAPGNKTVLTFLGAAREEKGFFRLPELAQAIDTHPVLSRSVDMRVQYSAPISGLSPRIRRAREELGRYGFVHVVEGALSQEAYAREMHASDVVMLMYNPAKYSARGSGIVMEALYSGKHVLAARGTFMEELPHQGLLLAGDDISDWVSHLERFVANLEGNRRRGNEIGRALAQQFSAEAALRNLINREAEIAAPAPQPATNP